MAWFDGLEPADIGHIQNRGLDKLEGDAAAKSLYSMYRGAESKLGLRPEQVLRLPEKPDDAAGWEGVWKALGKPETPDKYEFGETKFSDGEDLADDAKAFLKNLAHSLHLPASAAPQLAQQFVKYAESTLVAEKAAADAAAQAAKADADTRAVGVKNANTAALQAEWLGQYDANYKAAQAVALSLGYTADELVEMSTTPKFVRFMERMVAMRRAAGEAPLLDAGGTPLGVQQNGMSEEQLQARKQEIFDKYRNKMLSGEEGEKVFKEMAEIDRQLVAARHARR